MRDVRDELCGARLARLAWVRVRVRVKVRIRVGVRVRVR